MRPQRFFDEARRPVWYLELLPGEHAVLHVDRQTGHHRGPEGLRLASYWSHTIPVFPNLDEAVAYSEERVRLSPSIVCRIFKAGDGPDVPVKEVVGTEDALMDPRTARRRVALGLVMFGLGIVGFWIDWLYGWFYLLGVLIGVKFLTFGFLRLIEGVSRLRARRG
jgi:hypothetical protein